jgi:hypothetical protein
MLFFFFPSLLYNLRVLTLFSKDLIDLSRYTGSVNKFFLLQAVCLPLRAKSICSYGRAKVAVAAITFFSIGSSSLLKKKIICIHLFIKQRFIYLYQTYNVPLCSAYVYYDFKQILFYCLSSAGFKCTICSQKFCWAVCVTCHIF